MPKTQASAAPSQPASLAHRSLLDHPPGFRPFRGTDLFDRIGGQSTVDELVDRLYDGFQNDEQLRPLFPRDLAEGRSMQKLFFGEWLGGPGRYSQESHAGLTHRHDGIPITAALAGRWLGHFRRAMNATIPADRDRRQIFGQVQSLALALVKDGPQAAWCGIGARAVQRATAVARSGDVAGLEAALDEAPYLLRPTSAAAIMQAAALAGRSEVVRTLLEHGVRPDPPFYLPVGVTGRAFERVVYATPVCAARAKRRTAVESLLTAAGAKEDVFTAAFLGDLPSLADLLAADPDLGRTPDPAVDVLDITPVEHAVAGGQIGALRLILDHLPGPVPGSVRALRGAAEKGSLPMVELLLTHGADAARIGPGRWVLDPELAPLLAGSGAAIDPSGSWIGASCTGNQGRKDDPEYVRALLRYGANANDRRSGSPGAATGVGALNATALHYAAKAGFLKTVDVLLDHGADPDARDSQGRTPLDWLELAAPSVQRAAVRARFTAGRARRRGE